MPHALLEPCRIYVHKVPTFLNESKVPRGWLNNQYAVELWLERALERHPWRVASPAFADLVVVQANFSLLCFAGKSYRRRTVWDSLMDSAVMRSGQVPAFVQIQYAHCPDPWHFATPRKQGRVERPKDMVMLLDGPGRKYNDRFVNVVSPFVVSKPAQLVDGDASTASQWATRSRLLFFAGHVPKLYNSKLRYDIWRQVRTDARVTAVSSTLACTVGAYAACQKSGAELDTQPLAFYQTFCHKLCLPLFDRKADATQSALCGVSLRDPLQTARKSFDKMCQHYKQLDFGSELPHMIRDTRRVPHAEYISLAMSSRFCLIAPGDFESTHKVTEAMVIGGVGGCIPVFVTRRLRDVSTLLPYARWLDYCEVAYFVDSRTATTNMKAVLERLAAVSEAEARAKLAALRRVHDAFVFRRASTIDQPSAPHYILSEACAARRRVPVNGSSRFRAGGAFDFANTNVRRCALGPV